MYSRHISRTIKMISQVLSTLQEIYLFSYTIDDSQLDHLQIRINFPKHATKFSIEFADNDILHKLECIWKNSTVNYEKKSLYYNVKSIM